MHIIIKHIANNIGISLFLIFSILLTSSAYAEQSAEDVIKTRKALFSKNYKTAKRVQSLSSSGAFDEAKVLMTEMSKNYEVLLIFLEVHMEMELDEEDEDEYGDETFDLQDGAGGKNGKKKVVVGEVAKELGNMWKKKTESDKECYQI